MATPQTTQTTTPKRHYSNTLHSQQHQFFSIAKLFSVVHLDAIFPVAEIIFILKCFSWPCFYLHPTYVPFPIKIKRLLYSLFPFLSLKLGFYLPLSHYHCTHEFHRTQFSVQFHLYLNYVFGNISLHWSYMLPSNTSLPWFKAPYSTLLSILP